MLFNASSFKCDATAHKLKVWPGTIPMLLATRWLVDLESLFWYVDLYDDASPPPSLFHRRRCQAVAVLNCQYLSRFCQMQFDVINRFGRIKWHAKAVHNVFGGGGGSLAPPFQADRKGSLSPT